jgi:hypothetical protein
VTLIDSSPTSNQGFGLNGYLDLAAPASNPQQILPTLFYWNFPLSKPHADLVASIPVFSPEVFDSFFSASGVTVDPSLGAIGLGALDCLGVQASGVTFAMTSGAGADTKLFYLMNASPEPVGPTDGTGVAIFVNVPVGRVTITATPVALGRPTSSASVYVRAGGITEVNMSPTP